LAAPQAEEVDESPQIFLLYLRYALFSPNSVPFPDGVLEDVQAKQNPASLKRLVRAVSVCSGMKILNLPKTFLVRGFEPHKPARVEE